MQDRKSFWQSLLGIISRVFSMTEFGLFFLGGSLMALLMLFALTEVVGRTFLNRPVPGHLEILELFLGAAAFMGIAYTQRIGGHIRVGILIERLRGRWRHGIEFLVLFPSLVVITVMTVWSAKYLLHVYQVGVSTQTIHLIAWPFIMWVAIGSGLLSIRLLIELSQHLKLIVESRGGKG